MKSLPELAEFYKAELLPKLEVMEKSRQKAVRQIYLISAPIVILGVLIFGWFISVDHSSESGNFLAFIGFGVFALISGVIAWSSRSYKNAFKFLIIKDIVEFLDPELVYHADREIPMTCFTLSQIFLTTPDRYSGDDYVSGMIDKTKIEFSEVHAEREVRDNKGRRSYHTVFKGLFFVADFNKDFQKRTFVFPEFSGGFLEGMGDFFRRMNISRPDLVKLENPEFEKEFVVYGDDPIETRYILSTSLMERILEFKKKTGQQIYLSFVRTKVNIAISSVKGFFEPRLFKTAIDFKPVKEYYDDLVMLLGIVEDLNLNTRIWSKE